MRASGPATGRLAVAGALAGLAAGTKYNGVLLLVPLAIALCLPAMTASGLRLSELVRRQRLGALSAFAVAFAVCVPFIFFDYANYRHAMRALSASLQGGFGAPGEAPTGWWYHATVSLRYGLGLPLLLAGLAGLLVAARRDWRAAIVAFSFPLAYFAAAGSLGLIFVRYALPVVPFLCAGAALTVVWISGRLARAPFARGVVTALFAVSLAAPSIGRVVAFDRVLAQKDSRVVASEWLQRHAEPGSNVIVSGSRYGYPQAGRHVETWRWRTRLFLKAGRPVEGERPEWILLQESPLRSTTQPVVTEMLASGEYEAMTVLRAFDPASAADNLYDRFDAFFVPFRAFKQVRRPGPNFTIYKRRDARYVEPAGPAR